MSHTTQPNHTPQQIQTIQATAKKWKLLKILGVLMTLIGLPLLLIAMAASSAAVESEEAAPAAAGMWILATLTFGGGLVIYFVARFMAWWHHA